MRSRALCLYREREDVMWLFCSNKMNALPYGICKQHSIFLVKKDKTQMLFIGDIRDWENFKNAANHFIKNHNHKLIDINQYKLFVRMYKIQLNNFLSLNTLEIESLHYLLP